MLVVYPKATEPIDRVLKRFKKKFRDVSLAKAVRSKLSYKKPSVKRKVKLLKAIQCERYRVRNL